MAYFDNTNSANFYSTPSTPSVSGEFYPYPPLRSTLATDTECAIGQPYLVPTDSWGMDRRLGPIVGSPASLRATASIESVASATPYTTRTDGYYQPSFDWTGGHQQIQSHRPGFLSSDGSFVSTTASEMSTAMPTPSSVPFDYWGTNQSGAPTNGFCMDNADTSHWPRPGPTRAEMMPAVWFQPYGVTRTHPNWHRGVDAGSSIPPFPYIHQRRSQPSGGSSETTADAKTDQIATEEDRAPRQKLKRARLPRGQGKPRPTRVKTGKDGRILCEWVQQREKSSEPPTFNEALKTMTKLIRLVRPRVYQEPRLRKQPDQRTAAGSRSKNAELEYKRRNVERRWYEELSQFYQLPEGKGEWTRPPLLLKVLEDRKRVPPPPEKSNVAAP